MPNVHYNIIVWVALVGFVFSAVLALAVYLIDKNANRREKR
jgi:uncharacterized membrane protein YsdA (DUF1294 family)